MLAVARSTPNSPPKMDSSKLSVSNCRIVRSRDEPRAARTPNSLWRSAARLRKSVATFTQAISKTNVTAAKSTMRLTRRLRPVSHTNSDCENVWFRHPQNGFWRRLVDDSRLQRLEFGFGACPGNARREEAHDADHRTPGILCVFALRGNEHPKLRSLGIKRKIFRHDAGHEA